MKTARWRVNTAAVDSALHRCGFDSRRALRAATFGREET